MRQESKITIGKFVVMTLLVSYILFAIRKYLFFAFIDSQFVGVNQDLQNNRAMIEAQARQETNMFFLTYFARGVFGNWGNSYQSGESVGSTLFPALKLSLLSLLIASILCYIIGGLIIWYVNKSGKTEKLSLFRSNIALYLLSFVILSIVVFTPKPALLFYDIYRDSNVFTSTSFLFFSLLLLPLLSLGKFMHLLSDMPKTLITSTAPDLIYPNPQTTSNMIEVSTIPLVPSLLYIIKSLVVFQIEMVIILEQMLNLPGIGRILIKAALFFDFNTVIPCI